jgi:acyl-CoA hydrolase/RimJ/RimL family protein N-acetyltransferase
MDTQLGERFPDKVCTAEQAVARVRHGNRVFIGSGAGEPQSLVRALSNRNDLSDTELIHIMTLGIAPYAEAKFGAKFRHNAFFIGGNVREAVAECRGDYTPIFLSEVPALFREGRVVIDYALIQVSTPDEHGYCSYGVSTDIVKSAAESARVVIAEVNENTPRSLGDCFIHVRDIAALVPSDEAILEAPQGVPDELAKAIARQIANLIEDGSTLQLGIGTIPDAVLHFLDDRKDLGIHTELFSDGVIPLIEKGVINNSKKNIHKGKIIASFVLGSRKLYDFIHNNPMVEFHPTEYTNDPFRIARNDNMVAINSALEVDLTGQVCADSLGTMFYSGIGGQVDFVRGAARSRNGKAIIALPSTAQHEITSRIVPTLKPGAGVVTSRGDVHYVVTEYGMAYLHGKTIRERAMALIQIAHPKFRPWLLAEAKARKLVYADQIELSVSTPVYPVALEAVVEIDDGSELYVRPIRLTDEALMRDLFYSLSDEAVYHRFFHVVKSMPHTQVQKFLQIDYQTTLALVATSSREPDSPILGVGRYNLNPKTNLAEAAFVVRDEIQGKGIGTALFHALAEAGRSRGLRGFTAQVMPDNHAMLQVFNKVFPKVESRMEEGAYLLSMEFPIADR